MSNTLENLPDRVAYVVLELNGDSFNIALVPESAITERIAKSTGQLHVWKLGSKLTEGRIELHKEAIRNKL